MTMQRVREVYTARSAGIERLKTIRRDLLMLVSVFVVFRWLALLFFKPGGEVYQGGHDFRHYWEMAELSLEGYLPYLHYWVEYPPLFPWALVGLYHLSLSLPAWPSPILWFQVTVGGFLLVFEVGNLWLVYALARRMHGARVALRTAWVYAGLFLPVFALTNWFDAFPLFFLLLALYLASAKLPVWAGAAVGLGIMAKLIPGVAIPASFWAFATWRARGVYLLAVAVAAAVVSAPLLVAGPEMTVASFRSMLARSAWLTPWALLEGYFDVGYMPDLASRFVAEHAEWRMYPATLPWFWLTAALGGCYAWLFTRRLRWAEPRVLVAATALALNLLLLFSKGYSPQFLLYVMPLALLVLPGPLGLTYVLLLTLNGFVEWPLAGVYFRQEHWLWWAVILFRTTLLALLSWEYLVVLFPRLRPRWELWRGLLAPPAGVALVGLAAVGGVALAGEYREKGDFAPLATYVSELSVPGQALVASSRESFYALRPLVKADDYLSPRDGIWDDLDVLKARATGLTEGSPQVWLLLDHARGREEAREMLPGLLDSWGSRATDSWFGPYRLLAYVPYAGADPYAATGVGAVFDSQLALVAWDPPGRELARGKPFRVTLYWQSGDVPALDYAVFVHLVDETGALRAQRDRPLRYEGRTAASWQPGTVSREVYDLPVPADVPSGRYRLLVGLYEPASGRRLALPDGADGVALGDWWLGEP